MIEAHLEKAEKIRTAAEEKLEATKHKSSAIAEAVEAAIKKNSLTLTWDDISDQAALKIDCRLRAQQLCLQQVQVAVRLPRL